MAKPRTNSLEGLLKAKPGDNVSSVGPAPMDPHTQVEPQAPASVRVVEEPAGEHPVKEQAATKPAPAPKVEPEPEFEPEPEPQQARHVEIQLASRDAALHQPSDLVPVTIAFPVRHKKAKPDQIQLSVKLKGPLLERFERARHDLGVHGNTIGVEAIEIWLAHNGY